MEAFSIPEDQFFAQQWGLLNKGQAINGQSGQAGADINIAPVWGADIYLDRVVIGVLDSGIDTSHPDLAGRFVAGWDFCNEDDTVFDPGDSSHGMEIAGIITGNRNNMGIAGAADNAYIMPLKFMQEGPGYTSDAIAAIRFAAEQGVKIINCSWGGPHYNPALEDVMRQYSDILFICAAGNTGDDGEIYPASLILSNVVPVSAINNNGALWESSTYNKMIYLAAPGVNIYTTSPENSYGFVSGTSMAAAYVTAAAALYLGKNSETAPSEIAAALHQSAGLRENVGDYLPNGGILDVSALLEIEPGTVEPEEREYTDPYVLPEEVKRIVASGRNYESLDDAEKELVKEHAHVREDTMLICSRVGYNLKSSIDRARIMQTFEVSLQAVDNYIAMYPTEEKAVNEFWRFDNDIRTYPALSYQLDSLKTLSRLLLEGYRARNILGAFAASAIMGKNIDDIISHGPYGYASPTLSGADARKLAKLAETYSIKPELLVDFMNEKGFEAGDLETYMLNAERTIGIPIMLENKLLGFGFPYDDKREYPSTSFHFRENQRERINLNTGALILEDDLVSLKGRGDFDFRLTLRYDSSEASAEKIDYSPVPYYHPSIGLYYYNFLSDIPEYNPLNLLSPGWSFNVSYVYWFNGTSSGHIKLSDGTIYSTHKDPNNAARFIFDNYQNKDMELFIDSGTYPGAYYVLKHANGKREYFNSSGDIILRNRIIIQQRTNTSMGCT